VTAIAAAEAALTQVENIRLEELELSPLNPRKSYDEASIAELAASIRECGILNPLLIRVVPIEGDIVAYHIIAGSRRSAAAVLAGLEVAPCIAREMTDEEARGLAIIDNLQREDMPALEEADAYEALRQQLGDAEAIAARVGKPVEYVAKRLKLVTLGDLQRQALAERLIAVDHALLLARLGVEEQDKNLKWALDVNAGIKTTVASVVTESIKRRQEYADRRFGAWEAQSVLKLKNHIEQHAGRALSKAPWSLDDAELVKAAGACSGCPSNTAHNTALFADLAIEAATCEDGACFESKRDAFVRIKLSEAYSDKAAIQISWKSSEAAPRMAKDGSGPNEHSVLRFGQWLDVKKGRCPDVRNGVTVDWDEYGMRGGGTKRMPGQTLLVCIAVGCKVHPKSYEKKAKQIDSGNRCDPKAAKEERQKKLAAISAENQGRMFWAAKVVEATKKLPEQALRSLLIEITSSHGFESEVIEKHLFPGLEKALLNQPLLSTQFAQAVAVVALGANYLSLKSYSQTQDGRKQFKATCIELGVTPTLGEKPVPAKPAPKKVAAKKAVPAKKAAPKKAVKKAAKKGGRK
jgi:ParB/RepB/Spo0J family partition protein